MKTNKIVAVAMMAALTGSMMSSCSVRDNEKTPEVVEDPIKDIVEYYINGKVVDNKNLPLSGVAISAEGTEGTTTDDNGTFSLTVTEKSAYTVKAALDGYIGSNGTKVTIASNATNRSSVNVNFVLTKVSNKVDISASDATTKNVIINNGAQKEDYNNVDNGTAAIEIPQNTSTSAFSVTMTEYTPAPEVANNNSSSGLASVTNVNITTSNGMNANGITISVKDPQSNSQSFKEMEVYRVESSRAADKIGIAKYDNTTKSYKYKLKDGKLDGDYSFRVKYTRTVSPVKYELKKDNDGKYDNNGNFTAVNNYPIKYVEYMGWKYTSEFDAPASLKDMLNNIVMSQEGSISNVSTTNKEFVTNISGNSIMYYKAESGYTENTYKVELANKTVSAKTQSYNGTRFTYSQEVANQHSGGTSK